jgi:hypothetical protein
VALDQRGEGGLLTIRDKSLQELVIRPRIAVPGG